MRQRDLFTLHFGSSALTSMLQVRHFDAPCCVVVLGCCPRHPAEEASADYHLSEFPKQVSKVRNVPSPPQWTRIFFFYFVDD